MGCNFIGKAFNMQSVLNIGHVIGKENMQITFIWEDCNQYVTSGNISILLRMIVYHLQLYPVRTESYPPKLVHNILIHNLFDVD